VVVPFAAVVAGVGIERLVAAGAYARTAAAGLLMLMPIQFAIFTSDYFGSYRERASGWFGGNIRTALEAVLDETAVAAPSVVYIATEIPWVDAYWEFYSKVRRQDWVDRTHYIRLTHREIPTPRSGAIVVAPATETVATEQLTRAGWRLQVIPDLDGHPSMVIGTAATP